jgi:hypothetical protein
MDRWEPPRTNVGAQRRPRPAARLQLNVPEFWLMAGSRLAIAIALVLPAMFQQIRDNLVYYIAFVLLGLLAIGFQALRARMNFLRGQIAADVTIFVFLLPPLVLTGFVAAETRDLLPAERSAFIEAGLGVLLALVLLTGVAAWLGNAGRGMTAMLALPGFLLIPALPFVLHDYRNQTVIAIFAAVYFIAALTTGVMLVTAEFVNRYLPALLYATTVLFGVIFLDPGTGNLGLRDSLITTGGWMTIALGQIALVAIPGLPMSMVPVIRWGRENENRNEQPVREGTSDYD